MVEADDLVGPIVELIDRWPRGTDVRTSLDEVRSRLLSPVRVAVAGRVSTGKSTLVNALLHKAAAATGSGEVTRLVSYFRHGVGERVHLILLNGSRREIAPVRFPLDDGLDLPSDLDPRQVSHLEVTLQVDRLRFVTLVDTPGLASANATTSPDAERVVGKRSEATDDGTGRVSTVDAVVYVVNQDARADDAEAIDDFVAATGGGPAWHAPVVAVLNRADRCGGINSTPCSELVSALRGRLGGRVVDVVPMVANIAETVLAGRLSQPMVDGLSTLAKQGPPDAHLLWFDVEYFAKEGPLDASRSALLADRLGLYGVREAVNVIRSAGSDPTGLAAKLLELSGIAGLEAHLDRIADRAEILKTRRALLDLETIAWSTTTGEMARTMLAGVRDESRYDVIDELEILDGLESRQLSLDDDLYVHAMAVLGPGTVGDRTARAGVRDARAWREWSDRWRRFENTCETPRQARAARIVQRRMSKLRPGASDGCRTGRS